MSDIVHGFTLVVFLAASQSMTGSAHTPRAGILTMFCSADC